LRGFVAIVALARKLLVALWPYLETGVVPQGPQRLTNEDQIPITEAYEIQGGCVTVTGQGLKDAAEEKGPIPPWSPRPRNAHGGLWTKVEPGRI
jgi:hypothetical protein